MEVGPSFWGHGFYKEMKREISKNVLVLNHSGLELSYMACNIALSSGNLIKDFRL